MAINSCYGCLPPKRTTTCKFDGTCDRYAKAKEQHDSQKAAYDQKKSIDSAIYSNRSKKVYRAMRDRQQAKKARW